MRVAKSVWPGASGAGAKGSAPSARRGCLARGSAIGRRGVSRGSTARELRRRYPRSRAIERELIRANGRSTRIFATRGRKVRAVAVASRRAIARREILRRYLRAAGVTAR